MEKIIEGLVCSSVVESALEKGSSLVTYQVGIRRLFSSTMEVAEC